MHGLSIHNKRTKVDSASFFSTCILRWANLAVDLLVVLAGGSSESLNQPHNTPSKAQTPLYYYQRNRHTLSHTHNTHTHTNEKRNKTKKETTRRELCERGPFFSPPLSSSVLPNSNLKKKKKKKEKHTTKTRRS